MKKQDIFLRFGATFAMPYFYEYWRDLFDDGVFHMIAPTMECPIRTDYIQSDQSKVRNPYWEKI